jgi:hypothetical protein
LPQLPEPGVQFENIYVVNLFWDFFGEFSSRKCFLLGLYYSSLSELNAVNALQVPFVTISLFISFLPKNTSRLSQIYFQFIMAILGVAILFSNLHFPKFQGDSPIQPSTNLNITPILSTLDDL